MSVSNRRGYAEMMNLNPNIPEELEILKTEYRAVDIDKVTIGENTYTNYGNYQFILEKTYAISPERSAGGVIDNLNGIATFLTPRLIMDFSYMPIADYRSIMKQHYEKNEFVVICYDPIYNVNRTFKMYFATEEMAKLHIINRKIWNNEAWEDWLLLAGVTDYQVELIGTNASLDKLSVTYHLNPPSDTGELDETEGEPDVYYGEDLIIGANSTFPQKTFEGRYSFSKWNVVAEPTDKSKGNYINGNVYTINNDLVLYAQWSKLETFTLYFDYGIAEEYANIEGLTPSKQVKYDEEIGFLPLISPEYISVFYEGKNYFPYKTVGWYKTPMIASNSEPISNDDKYWAKTNSTIHLLATEIQVYTLYYIVSYPDGTTENRAFSIKYGVDIPTPEQNGYKFDGFYKDSLHTIRFTETTMPPKNLQLYARWVAE